MDGIDDIVVGAGLEGEASIQGVYAFNGNTGAILWTLPSRSQMYSSAQFLRINSDDTIDVLIAGRDAQLVAINGANGQILWEFWNDSLGNPKDSGWYNFYTPQLIDDYSGDGIQEILISNGGNAEANSTNDLRFPGKILIINSSNGEILASDTVPDGRETYFSPLVYGNQVVFGSGGETKPGSLWSIAIDSVIQSNLSNATPHLTDSSKGFIAVPTFANFNNDANPEWLIPQLNEKLVAYDVSANSVLWDYQKQGTENYVSPTLGYFNNDNTPDVVIQLAHGPFPFYTKHFTVVLDGTNGQVIYEDSMGIYQLRSSHTLDWDNDGYDEILQAINYDKGFNTTELHHRYRIIDINNDTAYWIWSERPGTSVYSMPIITDLDDDGNFEFIRVANNNTSHWYVPNGFTIERIELDSVNSVSWYAYMGKNTDGYFHPRPTVSLKQMEFDKIKPYPNPSSDNINISVQPANYLLYTLDGRLIKKGFGSSIELKDVENGLYLLKISMHKKIFTHRIVKD